MGGIDAMSSLLFRAFTWFKAAVFETGHLVYWLNIPFFRHSRRRVEALPKQEKVRIGFILQVPNNWAVLQSVYDAAKADPQVEPVVLLMPDLHFAFYIHLKEILWEKVYAFGEKQFSDGDTVIQTWNPTTKTWVDPDTLHLDYVFIPRPYDTYLPKDYRASALRRITRTCYVPYSSPLLGDFPQMYNIHFIRNLYHVFCEKQHSYDYVSNRLRITMRSGDQKVYNAGFPKFDLNWNMEGAESSVWPRPRDAARLRVLWTPRWTTDNRLCGSNFMNYREEMISWAEQTPDMDLVFRPHPLALENYVHAGLLTQEELDMYLRRYEECENATVDRNPGYYDTFWSSDLMITDMSSVLMDYMLTGRPIIFCPTIKGKTSSDDRQYDVKNLIDGMYVARSFDEIQAFVRQLAGGEDPKKELRAAMAKMMRREGHSGLDILHLIKADYFGKG